jgi:hypothetical protein
LVVKPFSISAACRAKLDSAKPTASCAASMSTPVAARLADRLPTLTLAASIAALACATVSA